MPKLSRAVRGFTEEEQLAWRLAGRRYRDRKFAKKAKKRKPRRRGRPPRRAIQQPTPSGHPKHLQVVILTYERPQALLRLLRDVYAWRHVYKLSVAVYDDASEADYAAPREMIEALGWTFTRAENHYGKHQFWRWVSRIYADQRRSKADFFVFLPDDARLCTDFFRRLCSCWAAIKDPQKIALTFLHDTGGNRGWTQQTSHKLGSVLLTGFVDGAFGCPRRYLEVLGYACPGVATKRWERDPTLGSGVGKVLSVRLHELGLSMYSVRRSLMVHTGMAQSHMNPEARLENQLRAVEFIDGHAIHERLLGVDDPVVVSIASMAYRADLLKQVIDSLYWQVDRINVYLDRYRSVPAFLKRPKIRVARSQKNGDRGDAGKFFWVSELENCYHFTCDDDIRYPPDYVARMRHHIERYGRRALISLHGAILRPYPGHAYYQERLRVYRCTRAVPEDVPVHIPGTGVLAYHTSTLRLHPRLFRHKNMADIWIGLAAKQRKIPVIVVHHGPKWICPLPDPQPERSVFARHSRHDALQARVVRRAAPWHAPLSASVIT